MSEFAAQLIKFFDDVRDAAECEFWSCPQTGDHPHHECCLTADA